MIYRIGDDRPQIHKSVFVADSADIMGKVVLKQGASVWFNAVIRGDCDLIEVGERSNIQDKIDYQTVFAEKDGAIAAPTAGIFFFAPKLLSRSS